MEDAGVVDQEALTTGTEKPRQKIRWKAVSKVVGTKVARPSCISRHGFAVQILKMDKDLAYRMAYAYLMEHLMLHEDGQPVRHYGKLDEQGQPIRRKDKLMYKVGGLERVRARHLFKHAKGCAKCKGKHMKSSEDHSFPIPYPWDDWVQWLKKTEATAEW